MHALAGSVHVRLPHDARHFSPRQQEVLDALERAFFQDGLDVTVGELATRASCSRRTLYELAASKEELFLLVLDRMCARMGRRAREAAAAERLPERRIEAFVAVGVAMLQPTAPAFIASIRRYAPAGWLFDHHMSLSRDFLVATLEDGMAMGRFRRVHPELVAEALMVATARLTEPRVLEANDLSAADALDELFGLVVHGLVAAPGRRRSAGAAEPADHGSAG